MGNALRAKPEDVRERYERRQLKDLQEAYGEAMSGLRARKKLEFLLGKDETGWSRSTGIGPKPLPSNQDSPPEWLQKDALGQKSHHSPQYEKADTCHNRHRWFGYCSWNKRRGGWNAYDSPAIGARSDEVSGVNS